MKILIIKTGALGDVLRTTSILHVLEGNIFWVTKNNAISLLENNNKIKKIIDINHTKEIENQKFDLVLSLDEGYKEAELASKIKTKKLIGIYLKNNKLTYTKETNSWNDMGLPSRFGKERADELKRLNKKTFQEILFGFLGKKFNGEEYILNYPHKKVDEKIIVIENRAGDRWPMKRWDKYEELIKRLKEKKYKIKILEEREKLRDYINNINECYTLICGDTLAMHIGLALKKKVITIFGPTSATEIYDYGRLKKIVSPIFCQCCYKRECNKSPNCMNQIKVEDILKEI